MVDVLFCAKEVTEISIREDAARWLPNKQSSPGVGDYLLERFGEPISVLSRTAFERDYTVVATWVRIPTEADLMRSEQNFGFFQLASDEHALFCKRRERRILALNGYAVYTGEKMLLHLRPMQWVEVTLAYDEQAGCYYVLDQADQRLELPPRMQQAAMHPRGHTCWGVWALPD